MVQNFLIILVFNIIQNTILHFDMSGILMCFNQRGPRKSYLEVQRLQEIGVVEWEKQKHAEVRLFFFFFLSIYIITVYR